MIVYIIQQSAVIVNIKMYITYNFLGIFLVEFARQMWYNGTYIDYVEEKIAPIVLMEDLWKIQGKYSFLKKLP